MIDFDLSQLGEIPDFPIDTDQMNRVFVNLVENAIAAIPDNCPRPAISFTSIMLDDLSTVRVEVRDNGIGIPPQFRDRVIEPYFSTKDGGTGLGLAIVAQIITDHGGYLRLQDNEPCGTRIIIELPTGGSLV
jgi:two-component system nitrogen regulation sensor histidine kinase NtrY